MAYILIENDDGTRSFMEDTAALVMKTPTGWRIWQPHCEQPVDCKWLDLKASPQDAVAWARGVKNTP